MCLSCNNRNASGRETIPAPLPIVDDVLPPRPVVIGAQSPLFDGVLPEIARRTIDGDDIPPVMVECDCCGDEREEEETQTAHNGDCLCDDCACSCENCGHVHTSDDISSASDGDSYSRNADVQSLCENCRWSCDDCSNDFHGDETRENASGQRICARCSENYSSCEECNDVIHQDDMHSIEDEDGVYCRSCYESRMADRESSDEDEEEEDNSPSPTRGTRAIHDYSYKPRAIFGYGAGEKDSPSGVPEFYGIEIETDGGANGTHAIQSSGLADDAHFYCKRDGSVPNGFEIVSHPATMKFWREHEFSFAPKLSALGYGGSAACGYHIHVSRTALSTPQLAKLLLFVKRNDEFMKVISRRKKLSQLESYASIDGRSTRALIRKAGRGNGHDERYTAINLENAATIEFRIFQGTLNVSHIRETIAIVACLMAFIRSTPLSRLNAGDFRSFIALRGRGIVGRELTRALLQWVDDIGCAIAA